MSICACRRRPHREFEFDPRIPILLRYSLQGSNIDSSTYIPTAIKSLYVSNSSGVASVRRRKERFATAHYLPIGVHECRRSTSGMLEHGKLVDGTLIPT
jgi:hypothetical protein